MSARGGSTPRSPAATAEVPVQFVFENAAQLLPPDLVLHDHQRRVLRERLVEHADTLHVGADQLLTPPLVRDLVRRDVERKVDCLLAIEAGVEPQRLGERDQAGKGRGIVGA